MTSNYYFLKKLSTELASYLQGKQLINCFSQEKDELVLGFADSEDEFWIKAILKNRLNTLVFPETFARTKGHSIDLFQKLIGLVVHSVEQHLNERAFTVHFTSGDRLIFKMFGNKSNLLLADADGVKHIFHKKFDQDLLLNPTNLDRPIDQSFEGFKAHGLANTFPTLGTEAKQVLKESGFNEMDTKEQYLLITKLLEELEDPSLYVTEVDNGVSLFLIRKGTVLFETKSAVEAANKWFQLYGKDFFINQEKRLALKVLNKQLKQSKNYLAKSRRKLQEIQEESRYEEIANILMANLHQIPPNQKKIKLFDFYKDQEIEIKVNPLLTPQKNAENFYRKSKNQKIEVEQLQANINKKEKEFKELEEILERIDEIDQIKNLRKLLKNSGMNFSETQEKVKPYKQFEIDGYTVLVGKNAKSNEELLQTYSYKDDLWLHARDVGGSHVIMKYQSGKGFPEASIEKVASLAAWYSQGKNDSLCPVMYAQKKFVHKLKGSRQGKVKLDQEKVILVEPQPYKEAQ